MLAELDIPDFLRVENREKPLPKEKVTMPTDAINEPKARAVVHAPPSVPAQISDTTAIVQMIERAARDPNVDIDKMERLLQMQERVVARAAKAEYDSALAEMQQELPVIVERGKITNNSGNVQSTYALWEDLNEAIKPVLAKHGFALSFRTGQTEHKIVVTGVLSHRGGHREETTMHLPTDTSGAKNAVQAVGSSTSYGKRYTAAALLNLTSRGEDDDGAGGDTGPISDEQVQAILKMIEETGADIRKFCAYLKVDGIAQIPAAQYKAAVAALNKKRKKQ